MAREKQPASTLFDAMNECHVTGEHKTAIIVFSQENWKQEYSELSRSYESHSNQHGWDYSKLGNCRIGNCLDGTDYGVRLDYYNWKIEFWYWK